MTDHDTIPTHGLTRCQLYGFLFRRGVRFEMARGFYLVKPERVELGHDLVKAYEATMYLPESSGGGKIEAENLEGDQEWENSQRDLSR